MQRISLTQGQFATVDDEDFEWLNQWTWCGGCSKKNCCTKGLMYYAKRTGISMHRQILGLKAGDKRRVKHINRNNLDNRRSNLEIVCIKKKIVCIEKKIASTKRSRWKELVYKYV